MKSIEVIDCSSSHFLHLDLVGFRDDLLKRGMLALEHLDLVLKDHDPFVAIVEVLLQLLFVDNTSLLLELEVFLLEPFLVLFELTLLVFVLSQLLLEILELLVLNLVLLL